MSLIGTIRDAVTGLAATVKQISTALASTDYGVVTNSVTQGIDDDGTPKKIQAHLLSEVVDVNDRALVVQSVIHGKTTAGGGTFVDVKVNPSGALTTESTIAGIDSGVSLPTTFPLPTVTFDAGGVMRVGQQTTLLSGKTLNADDAFVWESAGTGTGAYSANKFDMSVTSGQWYVRQTKRHYPYFDGKSQRVELTFDKFAPQANVTKRVGYFSSNAVSPFASDYDGIWLENDGSSIILKAAREGTETLSKDITEWAGYANLAEYQTLATWDYFTVIEFKFLWLGGAVLVLSVKTSDGFVEAHRFDYAGTAQDVFILSPNQPARYEIRSTTGTGAFREICSQIATEGSVNESGESLAVFNSSAITTNVVSTIYALIGLKKQTTYHDNGIQITDISVGNTANTTDSGILLLIQNPTLSATLTYANLSRIQVAYATTQTITASTGRVLAAIPASQSGAAAALNNNFLSWMSTSLAHTHDEYVLAYMPITANQSVHGVLSLKEY